MAHTTPIFVPLTSGLDLSKASVLGEKDLTLAENVDFSVQGEVRGRPGRAAPSQFIVHNGANAYSAAQSLVASGFRPNGLMRLKDGTDERPMLGTDGRLFALEGTEWKDRGAFAAMRVDQPHTYFTQPQSGLVRRIMGPDFGTYTTTTPNESVMSLMNPTTLGFERRLGVGTTPGSPGTMARCGTVTATVYITIATNNLRLVTRANGAAAFTDTIIAADAAAISNDGDAPVICCDGNQTVFFVIYQTTTANQYKVLRVTTAGAVAATYTGTLVGIHGHWVTNSAAGDDRVVIGLTNADGLTIKVLNATSMVDQALDSTHGTVACDSREVVVGYESSTVVWWAYRQEAGAVAGLRIGTVNPGSAASASLKKTYSSVDSAGGQLGVSYYTPMHQPVLFGGRMYLTITAYTQPLVGVPGVGTWYTLDLSYNAIGGTPALAARGRTDATAIRYSGALKAQPEGAVLRSDTTGWTFPSIDWVTFETTQISSTAGQQAVTVLNLITRSGPRCVVAGDATLFSGSVPRSLAGDRCYEAGFPAARPVMQVNPSAVGGFLADGSYTLYTCWMYVDGAGQIHRSSASSMTQATGGGGVSYIDVYVQTPYFTERPAGDIFLEIYCTAVNPATDDPAYLQAVVTPSTTAGATKYQLTGVVTTTEGLYILDNEFAHITPSADGGIAAMGRRVWLADRATVYASLLLNPREGATWNDEGSLSVDLPAGAGRILALEALEDKLIVFCERGVYVIQDGGPNNVGVGPDIAYPIRITDLGCAGPRSTCVTDRGVVFCSPLDSKDPQRGGPWLLDRSLSLTERQYLGSPALTYFTGNSTWVPEVAFSPERQQLYVTIPVADSSSNTGVAVIDMRMSKWATWSTQDAATGELRSIDVVNGCLWSCNNEPAGFTELPDYGTDDNVPLRVRTTHLFADGRDGLGWSRVRSISVLGSDPPGSTGYNMTIYALQDQTITSNSGSMTIPDYAADTAWPGTRTAPEWLLPRKKCSSIQVTLESSAHNVRWSAIRLDVRPLSPRAPARTRS